MPVTLKEAADSISGAVQALTKARDSCARAADLLASWSRGRTYGQQHADIAALRHNVAQLKWLSESVDFPARATKVMLEKVVQKHHGAHP